MKIGRRALWLIIFAALALFFAAGCERSDNTPFTAEIDESGYRRAKELLRQGRNQEALAEFQKVIEKRGLNNAPESHLELGLLYQNHIRDPIAAIYHYRRYLELKPDVKPQADLVKQRIDAATREFARTLPAQPLENMERFDMSDVVQRLQRENEQLKTEVGRLRAQLGGKFKNESASLAEADDNMTETSGPAQLPANSPIPSPLEGEGAAIESAQALPPPSRPSATVNTTLTGPLAGPAVRAPSNASGSAASTTATTPSRQTAGARRHVVVKGDTLYSLSQKYYGTRSRWRDILEANHDILRTKDDPLRIGVEIKIPQ
ncbi:MAG TPA: LysM peptidoglycan-binding domain-containing protein [Opitutaceae bacterium]|nr:LysM peptidoglycan-binding domain-containing protein [Opitutaceae bacterium]